MSLQLFSNGASALLTSGPYSTANTVFTVATGDGALFPNPAADEHIVVTLQDADGNIEICHCTSRSVDDLTLLRAQESTAARIWEAGDRIEVRPTAGAMGQMLQNQDDRLEGPLDGNNQVLSDIVIIGGSLQGSPLRNTEGGTDNQINVPAGSDPPTVGGAQIWTEASLTPTHEFFYIPPGTVWMWYSALITNVPDGWTLCDGRSPAAGGPAAPDMRGRFVLGQNYSDGSYDAAPDMNATTNTVLATGGSYGGTTAESGSHTHTGGGHSLTKPEISGHQHFHIHSGTEQMTWGQHGTTKLGIRGNENSHEPTAAWVKTDWGIGLSGGDDGYMTSETDEPSEATPHIHTTGSSGSHTHDLTIVDDKPFIVLSFIIKLNELGKVPV